MTPDEFRACLDTLAWSQRGLAAILDFDDRTVRRWAAGTQDVPSAIAAWLRRLAEFHAQHPPPGRSTAEAD